MELLETLEDHLNYKRISINRACQIFGKSERTLKRWNDHPPEWVLNILDLIDVNRNIPIIEKWNGYFFYEDELILPNGDKLSAEDIQVLRFEQLNRTTMKDHPHVIRSLKEHLELKTKSLNSTVTIQLENSGETLKTWKVSI